MVCADCLGGTLKPLNPCCSTQQQNTPSFSILNLAPNDDEDILLWQQAALGLERRPVPWAWLQHVPSYAHCRAWDQ